MRTWTAPFLVFWLAGCATTAPLPASPLKFPAEAVTFTRPNPLRQTMLFRPQQGTGPFPAVVLEHTCGGVAGHLYDWAMRFTRNGYVVMIIDSLTPRGLSDNCLPAHEATVSVDDVNGDIAAAFAHLRSLPIVKADALGLVGFSFGAIASVKLAGAAYQARVPGGVPGLRAIALLYGDCINGPTDAAHQQTYAWANDFVVPVYAFLGGIDNEALAERCVASAERLKARGLDVRYKVYADTTHGFDQQGFGTEGRNVYHGTRGPFFYRYNPQATEDAWGEIKAMFDRELQGLK